MIFGSIKTTGGRIIRFSGHDATVAARMIVGEGETNTEGAKTVLACMLRRLALVDAWPTLAALLQGTPSNPRGYSQPISLYWRNRGTTERKARRARIASLSPVDIKNSSPHVWPVVLRMLLIGGPLPDGAAIHFADGPTSENSINRNAAGGWQREPSDARNVMVSTSASRRYIAENGQPIVTPSPILLAAPAVSMALAARLAL